MRGLLLAAALLSLAAPARAGDPVPGWEPPPDDDAPQMPPAQKPDGADDEAIDGIIREDAPPEGGDETQSGTQPGARPASNSNGTPWTPSGSGSSPSGSGPAPAAANKAAKKAARSRGSAASKAASKMAETMKSFTKNANADLAAGLGGGKGAGDMLGGGRGQAGGMGLPRGAGPSGATLGGPPSAGGGPAAAPAAPTTSAAEVASWMGPYADLVASRGLVAERAPDGSLRFRRKDGSPASAEEVAGLRAAAAREPGALQKYPDFFSAISRADYGHLRDEFERNSARPTFKDVDMTKDERKDLVWNRSCDALSGDCNKHDDKGYKKNDYVKPKAARSMWKELLELAGAEDEEKKDEPKAAPGRARPTVPDSIFAEEKAAAGPAVAAAGGAAPAGTAPAASAPVSAPARVLAKLPAMLGFKSGPGAGKAHVGWIIGLLGLATVAGIRKIVG